MKRRDLQLLPTSIEVLPQMKRWKTVHKNITEKPRTFSSCQMKTKTTTWYHVPKNQKAGSNQKKDPQSLTLHPMNKSAKSESLIKQSHLKMQWSSTQRSLSCPCDSCQNLAESSRINFGREPCQNCYSRDHSFQQNSIPAE